ncbi:MAG TPA: hypothetical protein VG602_01635 [Actinomycetota bacterium]|nr:hypothetical protein [Actinomycetota bacterium]
MIVARLSPSSIRRLSVLGLAILLLPACRGDRVRLADRLEPGRRLEHELHLEARISRALAGRQQRQDVVATFRAAQQILAPLPDGGAEATFSLIPQSLEVNGQPVEVGPDQDFNVHLGPDGRVVAIEEAGGQPGEALGPLGIERLLPRLRPVLPGALVAPGDRWRSRTNFVDETGTFSLTTSSRLSELGLLDGREAALVRTTYRSPVDRRETFANAVAHMQGTDVGAQEAWFALDGSLLRSSGDSVGSYRVTFSPPGGEVGLAPVEGTLVVRLHTELRLISSPPAAPPA